MKHVLYIVCLFIPLIVFPSQPDSVAGSDKVSRVSMDISGFVRSDFWVDSRAVVQAREAIFSLYPENILLDENGKDIHGDPVFNFSAIATRFTSRFQGPDAFGAQVNALVEADFTGVTNADINGFRLRHAYVDMQWEHWGLMLGQFWHPLFVAEVFPTVVSLNTGVPFQPFIRNPLATIRFQKDFSRWMFSLVGQRDNASDGPGGVSSEYLRNALLPNVHLQWTGFFEHSTIGFGADYKILRPRQITANNLYTDEHIGTYALLAYGRYFDDWWDIKAKVIYGQNLSEHLLMGGYAESYIDPETGYVSYTSLNHLSVWGNIVYGERVRPGLFFAYNHNFGAKDNISGNYYGRGSHIAYIYRVSPSVALRSANVELCAEFEYTAAAYGEPDNRGRVRDHSEVANLRLLLTVVYYF